MRSKTRKPSKNYYFPEDESIIEIGENLETENSSSEFQKEATDKNGENLLESPSLPYIPPSSTKQLQSIDELQRSTVNPPINQKKLAEKEINSNSQTSDSKLAKITAFENNSNTNNNVQENQQ